ncbi:MAG: transglutaminase-like domain-containing protein [Planctomycetia bacterium]
MPDDRSHDVAARPATAWLTVALAMLSCISVEIALRGLERSEDITGYAVTAVVAAAFVLAVGELLRRRFPSVAATGRSRLYWTAGVLVAGLVTEAIVRGAIGKPILLDVAMLLIFRNIVIALAAVAHHEGAQRLCNMFATFLVVFASASANALWVQGLVVLFALVGVWWLMGSHWESLQHRLEASSDRALPRRWLLALPLGLLCVLLCVPAASRQIHALDGFMPTSGGRKDSSPAARSGIGDGDQLVAGLDNIRSFAPIENAPFMSSHDPTLYDVYDDMYNEPVVQKKQSRAISLPPQTTVKPEDHSMAKSSRASREFSTVRQRGTADRKQRIRDLGSRALFYVKGRVPLHLKLETFDLYDGVDWIPEQLPPDPPRLCIDTVHGRPWLRIARSSGYDFFAAPELHAIKVCDLDTCCIPAPNELMGIHIDQVAQADFFRWEHPGVVAIAQPKLPDMLTVHLQSRLVDPRLFARSRPYFRGGPENCRQFGADEHSMRVRELAESWVAGVPPGWKQVERIVERVRGHGTLDAAAVAAANTDHSVADFLFETRRGPDYLFAGAAVWALRSLGYTARLVSGFHADPRRYDARSDHTPVAATDVHFWVEVQAGPGHWMTLDPTPGYAVLGPPLSLAERMLVPVFAFARAVARHPLAALAACVIFAFVVRRRARIADWIDEALWRLRHRPAGKDSVISLLRLLERRATRAGLPRPRHITPSRWLDHVAMRISSAVPAAGPVGPDGRRFTLLADEALYAPVFAGRGVDAACNAARTTWSWRHVAAVPADKSMHELVTRQ